MMGSSYWTSAVMGKVLLLEPFCGESHKVLVDFLDEHFETVTFTLPPQKWHWKARTSALYLAQIIPSNEEMKCRTLFVSSVLNLAELVALRPDLAALRKILYFHENQLVYPIRKVQERDFQFGYNQILSSMVADTVVFNSCYNMSSFLESIASYLKLIPDHRPKDIAKLIEPKCVVLHLPLSVIKFDALCESNLEDAVFSFGDQAATMDSQSKKPTQYTANCNLVMDGSSESTMNLCGKEEGAEFTPNGMKCQGVSSNSDVEGLQLCDNSDKDQMRLIKDYTGDSSTERSKIIRTLAACNHYDIGGISSEKSKVTRTLAAYDHDDTGDISTEGSKVTRTLVACNHDDTEDISGESSKVTWTLAACGHEDLARRKCLHIVWPHRWEHDKNPDLFFQTLLKLQCDGFDFRVSVLGGQFSQIPDIFEDAKEKLSAKICHWGYQASKRSYYSILRSADVVVSTADHEFFGLAMLEAAYLGCYPLCPNKLAYPEFFPKQCLYNTSQQLYKRLRDFCRRPRLAKQIPEVNFGLFSEEVLVPQYQKVLEARCWSD